MPTYSKWSRGLMLMMIPSLLQTAGWWWCTLVEVSCFFDQNRFPKYVSMSRFCTHILKESWINLLILRQDCHILAKSRWPQKFSRIILLTLFQEFWLKMEQHWEFDWLFTRILVEFWSHLVWWQRKQMTDSGILQEFWSGQQPTSPIVMTVATNNFHVLGCHAWLLFLFHARKWSF